MLKNVMKKIMKKSQHSMSKDFMKKVIVQYVEKCYEKKVSMVCRKIS